MKKRVITGKTINDCDQLTVKINDYLNKHNLVNRCQVEVKKQDKWYEFKGKVDSHETCSDIFEFVPRKNGAQFIINHMSVQ